MTIEISRSLGSDLQIWVIRIDDEGMEGMTPANYPSIRREIKLTIPNEFSKSP